MEDGLGNSYTQNQSVSRLIACGLTKSEAKAIAALIQKWVDCSGEEETVKRLKHLKDAYLHHLVGQKFDLQWFKKHPSGKPKGPLGALWKFRKKDLFKCWNAIMLYSGMTFESKHKNLRMTARQYAKFISSVNRQPVDPLMDDLVNVLMMNFSSTFNFPKFKGMTGSPIAQFTGSPTRRAPDTAKYMGSSPESETAISSIAVLSMRPKFTKEHWSIYSGVLTGFEETWDQFAWTKDNSTSRPLSGRIGIIQEPGYKARVVANPYRVHQCAMLPLKNYLFSLFNHLPNDYVYNQEAGVQYVQGLVRQGRKLFSIDLQNASDNLPLKYQADLLKLLGVRQDWISAFVSISSGDWELPEKWLPREKEVRKYLPPDPPEGYYPYNGADYLRWYEGQPLGLGPSFASAFLFHHAIVVGCHVLLNVPLEYAMVGDDLVLANEEVYNLYRFVMDSIGVKVSKEKTLISDQAGEFLSRIILPDMILRGYKWKGSGDNSFWDVAKALGPRSMRLFKPRQRRILRILGELPEPYGLGWNPNGRSYWDRLSEWIEALETVDVRVRTFESGVRSLNRLLYASTLRFITETGFPVSAVPDQGIVASLETVFPSNIAALGEVMIPNVDYLARLIDDMGDRATEHDRDFVKRASIILSNFSVRMAIHQLGNRMLSLDFGRSVLVGGCV
jgi:hypothetical protein